MKELMVLDQPEQIKEFQLRVVISAIKLEAKGIKVRRYSVKAVWAKKFGLSPRASHELVIQKVQEQIELLRAEAVGHG